MSVLEVKNIKKNFGKTEVLKGISFSLEKGEVLSIIGSSGSGKTTLLRCLNFLEFAESGTISVGGKIIFDGERVAIARALALEPDILCFDEPTSALDPELTGEVLRVIKDLKSTGSTMIVVTHEMEFARNVSDKVLFMADGVVEESGTPEEVFGTPQSDKTKSFLNKSLESV